MCKKTNLQKTSTKFNGLYKVVVFFFILLSAYSSSIAQYVSLSNVEITKLIFLVKNDKKVNKQFQNFQKLADSNLLSNPNPIEVISSAGRLQGDPVKTATVASVKDFKIMYALAISYRVTSNSKYIIKATEYFLSWASTNHPSGSPIDDTNLDGLIEAYDLLKNNLKATDKLTIQTWLEKTAIAETSNLKMLSAFETGKNNWNSHRLKVVGEIAYSIDNEKLKKWTIEKLKDQIAVNLMPDGSSLDFALRDAVHYHVYDLEPLVRLSILLKRATSVDYFRYLSENNSSIKKSVDWLIPFVNNEKTHQEFVNSTVKFDKARSNNKEAGHNIGQAFLPAKAIKLLSLCTYFNYPFDITPLLSDSKPNSSVDWQLTLSSLMK